MLPFHLVLDISIIMDISTVDRVPILTKSALGTFLHETLAKEVKKSRLIAEVERDSGTAYTESNIDWFYRCMMRPSVPEGNESVIDRKGKQKAPDQDAPSKNVPAHRILKPSGLVPTL